MKVLKTNMRKFNWINKHNKVWCQLTLHCLSLSRPSGSATCLWWRSWCPWSWSEPLYLWLVLLPPLSSYSSPPSPQCSSPLASACHEFNTVTYHGDATTMKKEPSQNNVKLKHTHTKQFLSDDSSETNKTLECHN